VDRYRDRRDRRDDHPRQLAALMEDDDENLTTLEVKLVRYINADGKMAFRMVTPPEYNVVEILGLLEAAKFTVFNNMGGGDD
jgi:hypothetical protein